MRPSASQLRAFIAARVLVATALALVAAGAAFMFLDSVMLMTGPVGSEGTLVHAGAVLLALAGVVLSSCVAIWGLVRAVPPTVLAGAGGVAVGSAILMLAAEDVNRGSEQIDYWRALFVLVLGLVVVAGFVGWRLRGAAPGEA